MKIEIFADVACPWCFIAKRRLEHALSSFEHRDQVELVWRSYELAPQMPSRVAHTSAEDLIHVKGVSPEEAQKRIDVVTKLAATVGIEMNFEIAKLFNSRKAHELIHYTKSLGLADAMEERLFRANFTEGLELGEISVLVDVAEELGLDREETRKVLTSGVYTEDVIADERQATELGVQIPYMNFADHEIVTGAKRAEILRDALDRAWALENPAA